MFGKFIRRKVDKDLSTWAKTTFKKIDMDEFKVSTLGFMNNRCHWNSYNRHLALGDDIVKVFCVKKDGSSGVVAHFINRDSEGSYIDVTLNTYGIVHYDYYFVEDFETIDGLWMNMTDYLDELHRMPLERVYKNKYTIKFLWWLHGREGLC